MKNRLDFVTNSSSSSFIIKNKTGEKLSPREVIELLLKDIINDADYESWELEPNESLIIECEDSGENKFEQFIHNNYDCWSLNTDSVEIKFHRSHH